MYVPHRQSMTTGFGPVSQDVWAYVRATGPLPLGDVRRAVSRVSASAAVAEYDDLGAVVAKATRQVRLRAGLLAAFSAVALCLAAVGIYGVTLQSVVQRTKEIGIRIALGAVTRQINMMVLSRGLTLAVTGFALGIAGSAALAQALSGLLYGVRPTDPLVFALVGVVLLSVAGLAAYLPARRASRVSPTVVLRYE
jgi:putative ABC transport system permease protein